LNTLDVIMMKPSPLYRVLSSSFIGKHCSTSSASSSKTQVLYFGLVVCHCFVHFSPDLYKIRYLRSTRNNLEVRRVTLKSVKAVDVNKIFVLTFMFLT